MRRKSTVSVKPSVAKLRQGVLGVNRDNSESHAGSPMLGEIARDVLFKRIWSRTDELDRRSRRLLSIAALTTLGSHEEMGFHVEGALRSGDLTREEIGEAAAHLAMYVGMPRARNLALVNQRVSKRLGKG